MLESQPQLNRYKPNCWEDLTMPHPSEDKKETGKGMELKQLPKHVKYVFLKEEQ